jgi:acyl-CoA hydrolase
MLSTPAPRWLVLTGVAGAAVLAGTAVLWAHFGTVVFFETIRTGFAACFG